ncbi:hypothetical protein XA68_10045 [Ophiocordyceps unilateralis]|uniref:Uncharacterized protein n=1 Tax=Ophiocordyceps unilateralis TaxID=268505 RepID=A0A2A9PVF1_OPHUN|nr:hypothetical protein XA68_10045 [Ophiocordyceps unilateralis]
MITSALEEKQTPEKARWPDHHRLMPRSKLCLTSPYLPLLQPITAGCRCRLSIRPIRFATLSRLQQASGGKLLTGSSGLTVLPDARVPSAADALPSLSSLLQRQSSAYLHTFDCAVNLFLPLPCLTAFSPLCRSLAVACHGLEPQVPAVGRAAGRDPSSDTTLSRALPHQQVTVRVAQAPQALSRRRAVEAALLPGLAMVPFATKPSRPEKEMCRTCTPPSAVELQLLGRGSQWARGALVTPRICERGLEAVVEARGVALYYPQGGRDGLGTMLAVSPLEDGSICLWDVNGNRGRQGSIVARSRPGSLFVDEPSGQNSRRTRRVDADVIESVSVSDSGHRAFFAVQSHLIEVDLNRLDVVSRESFEWSITALSAVHDGVPLTVGTSLGIHLHDFRARARVGNGVVERLDGPREGVAHPFRAIFDPNPLPPYAPLSQPTPISILHLPRQGTPDLASDDIYVSGRFSNILHYDRRKFPSIAGSIYSGALIKSLTSLPMSFSTVDAELRWQAELSAECVAQTKTTAQGQTLIAGGGYNTKGSLELYGLNTAADSTGHGMLQNSALKNRQTAASATILSVINHGTKLVFSDGTGLLKWFERDGITECRRLRIGHSDSEEEESLFASMPASDDLARKILSTRPREGSERLNDDNILFWTGEKLGMVTFTPVPRFDDKEFVPAREESSVAEEEEEGRRRLYGERMRRALDRQADEVRFMGNLGMGMGAS